MANVAVHITNLGVAAAVGCVRFDRADASVIVVHSGLTLEEQAAAVRLLLRAGEEAHPVLIPSPRTPHLTPRLATG